ncbi:MAG: hypothetical protein EOP88_06065 [Verrucomicrobiaceae bacterium]|nr:MAG: hypothetical protein EOP88_06065 [Verrucomicrobiaceae bacterium]
MIATALLAGALLLMMMRTNRPEDSGRSVASGGNRPTAGRSESEASTSDAAPKTKVANRDRGPVAATHPPQRLREFILPEVKIEGLGLEEALRKLYATYQDACIRSGEHPLPLEFTVPPGNKHRLNLRLAEQNFNSSVHLLAALCGMKVSRDDLEYRFEPIAEESKLAQQAMRVSPDLSARLLAMAGLDPETRMPFTEIAAALGLELDASTRLSLTASGVLNMESASFSDVSALTALVKSADEQRPLQHKFTSHLLELSPDYQGTLPDLSVMAASERLLFLRNMAQKIGVTVSTFPTCTAKSGQDTTVEVTRELIAEKEGIVGEFESHQTGHILKIRSDSLGFGHDLSVHYTDTTGALDPVTLRPIINRRTDISDTGFSGDNNTRISVQTRPDGSKTLFLLTSEMIDATGRPIRPLD